MACTSIGVDSNDVRIVTFNLHGFNQGKSLLANLCRQYNVFLSRALA